MKRFASANKITFKERNEALLKLEKDYGSFVLSCRHKDILRCSVSKHFRSCYSPNGVNNHLPFLFCSKPNIAIIGKKDKSGDWLWRSFIRYEAYEIDGPAIVVHKFYGNGAGELGLWGNFEIDPKLKEDIEKSLLPYQVLFKGFDCSVW